MCKTWLLIGMGLQFCQLKENLSDKGQLYFDDECSLLEMLCLNWAA